MKWRVHPTVFENKVVYWMDKIRCNEDFPPLIINFEQGMFEINCNNPLFEALKRSQLKEIPVIIWSTERADYDTFVTEYADYIENNLS